MSKISSTISATALRFNNSPISFEVMVKNLSNDYAAFKISLTAAGADPNLKDSWYSLDPISSTFIPPGDRTKFEITILAAPVRGIDLINLEIKVASLELPDLNFHNLKLLVSPERERLNVDLPVKSFAIYPRQVLDIPVRVSNPNHHQVDAVLKLAGLNSGWLSKGSERRLLTGAGKEGETSFICQPPIVKHTPCGIYPFTIEANVDGQKWGQTRGKVEILPLGTVFFSVTPECNAVSGKLSGWRRLAIKPATYQLELKNASNVHQNQIAITVEDKGCACRVIPPLGTAKAGETEHLNLEVSKKLPWWGLKRRYPLKIIPSLSDLRLNTTNPSSHNIELWVQPILPLWLQLGLGAIATVSIVWLASLFSAASHSARVNSVTFGSNINPVLSASTDGTVRQWKASPDNLICQWFEWQRFCLQHQDILLQSQAKDSLDEVNVIKLRTDNNLSGSVAFLGFDSGKVSQLDIQKKAEKVLVSSQDAAIVNDNFNRVLDLVFSPDLKKVFLGRGTKLSQLNLDNNTESDLIKRENSIYVLTMTPNRQYIIAGGAFNKIYRLELKEKGKYTELDFHPLQNKDADRITGLQFTENNILVSTDNRGSIKLWNFNQCSETTCKLLDSNEKNMSNGISAIALAKYRDKHYLVTGDDRGKIKLWSFVENLENIKLETVAEIAQYPQKIRSIDLFHQTKGEGNRFLILSGSEDKQVRLDIFELAG